MSGDSLKEILHRGGDLFNEPPSMEGLQQSPSSKKKPQNKWQDYTSHASTPATRIDSSNKLRQSQRSTGGIDGSSSGSDYRVQPPSKNQNTSAFSSPASQPTSGGQTSTAQMTQTTSRTETAAPTGHSAYSLPQRDKDRQLQDLMMLFPNHTEDELNRVLAEVGYDLDRAITAILGKDNLANAPSADELMDDSLFTPPTAQTELIGEDSLMCCVEREARMCVYTYIAV